MAIFSLLAKKEDMHPIEQRLKSAGLSLPEAMAPVANYVPFIMSGKHIIISGQISVAQGTLIKGKVGQDLSVEEANQAAQACGLHLLAQAKKACDGDLSLLRRCIRLGGFVNCTPDFTDHPKVINGASDLMVLALENAGRHARAAVGVPSLPLGAAVEIDAIFEIA